MEFNHNNVRRVVEEDRLSSLPDELIQKIMSSFYMKFSVQTCVLSSRWEFIWKSLPCLNLSSEEFRSLSKFAKFVNHVLSHRNHEIEVSSVKLDIRGAANQVFVRKIANYSFSHNVQELTVSNRPLCRLANYPPCLCSSQSLKHFTVSVQDMLPNCITLATPLDFPVLTTMHLSSIALRGDLFSKCVNLKNLTLEVICLEDESMEVLDIINPRLSNLILKQTYLIDVINVIAPQLENLTITDCSIEYLNAPPGLSSLFYTDYPPQQLSKDGFHSLNKVTLYLNLEYEEDARKVLIMLQELHSAKYLTLDAYIIERLSSFPDLLSHHLPPFSNLICLTIDYSMREYAFEVKMSSKVINFFLQNCPNANFTLELPKGS